MDPYIKELNHIPVETFIVNNTEYNSIAANNNNSLKIFHNNIRSIAKNGDELDIFLTQFSHSFDVLILTETWRIHNINMYNRPNYDIMYNEGNVNQNDGVIIYIKKTIEHCFNISKFGNMNVLCVKLFINEKTINIFAAYRSPSTTAELFNNELKNFLNLNSNNLKQTDINFLIGDINIHINNSELPDVQEYLNILSEDGFISLINKTTREVGNQKSCIDHIFVKTKEDLSKFIPLIYDTKITDHYPIAVLVDLNIKNSGNNNNTNYKKYVDYNKLNIFLLNENWEEFYATTNVNLATNTFITKLKNNIEKSTRIIKVKSREIKRNSWITKGIIKSIETKNNLYKKHKKDINNREQEKEYKTYRNKLNLIIKNTKIQYYRTQINNNKNNSKNLWTSVKNICNEGKKMNSINKIKL